MNRQTYTALGLERYIVLDLETTGLDPEHDEILEVGMVRVESGDMCERYSQLFNPSDPIPLSITHLTGIRTEDCQNQPSFNEKANEILTFLDTEWIIMHNADFDLSFLQKALDTSASAIRPIISSNILDTLEISRILQPWLPNHRLKTIAEFLDVEQQPSHRALSDAEATASIFQIFISHSLTLNLDIVDTILHLLEGASDGLLTFFENLHQFLESSNTQLKPYHRKGPSNILGKEIPRDSKEEAYKIDLQEIESFFEEDGILARTLSKYEIRKPQQEMAKCIARSFNQENFLLAEAGTGVGKSLAYLIPSLHLTKYKKNERVVISTHTKTLQNQLFTKELPLLIPLFNESLLAVLLKGRANYICRRRWSQLLTQDYKRYPKQKRRKLLPLVVWLYETQTGDIEENAGFRHQQNRQIWSDLNCEGRHCLGSRCESESFCFYRRLRRVSRSANIVLVNHALLFSDAAAGHTILGNYETLIIDEAHQIERIASDCLGKTLQRWTFLDISQRLYQDKPKKTGILLTLKKQLRKLKTDETEVNLLLNTVDDLIHYAQELPRATNSFFAGLVKSDPASDPKDSYYKRRFRGSEALFGNLVYELDNLQGLIDSLCSTSSNLLSQLERHATLHGSLEESLIKECVSIVDQLIGLKERLSHFLREDYGEDIVWTETRMSYSEKDIHIYSAPLNIADILTRTLYPQLKRCLLTSATLSIGEKFHYIMNRLGMDQIEEERVTTRLFGSPFEFAEQALVIIPTFLSNPKEKAFASDVSAFLQNVISIHSRGTMMLFTSHKLLREVYYSVQTFFNDLGIRLLGQGIDGSRDALLKMFQDEEKSVLLGTNSFWEGVDVPGSALECLIITKLPFDVPTEPMIEARMERVQNDSGNGFLNYAVPEAIVKFRQGFGRLIRSREDKGAVILLDNRVINTNYGRLFLESLPVEPNIIDTDDVLSEALHEWFA